jgi:hypothetical protein
VTEAEFKEPFDLLFGGQDDVLFKPR